MPLWGSLGAAQGSKSLPGPSKTVPRSPPRGSKRPPQTLRDLSGPPPNALRFPSDLQNCPKRPPHGPQENPGTTKMPSRGPWRAAPKPLKMPSRSPWRAPDPPYHINLSQTEPPYHITAGKPCRRQNRTMATHLICFSKPWEYLLTYEGRLG